MEAEGGWLAGEWRIATIGTGFIVGGIALVTTGNNAYTVSNPTFGTIGAGRWHNFPCPA